jgi:hypothetical protein
MTADNIIHEDFTKSLSHLDYLLSNLSKQLLYVDGTNSHYGAFISFELDSDILKKTEDEVATPEEQLEHIFGWKSQMSGDDIIPILE